MSVFFRFLSSGLFLLFAAVTEASSTMRCGNALVSLGDRPIEVQDKCGEAHSREMLGYRTVRVRSFYGFRQEEVAVEEWSYLLRGGMLYFLRFEGSRLVDIKSKRKNY